MSTPDSSPLIPPAWLRPILDAHTSAETELITEMAKRLRVGLGSDDWATLRAGDTAGFRRKVDRILSGLADATEPAVVTALARSYGSGYGTQAQAPDTLTRRVLGTLRASWGNTRTSATRAWNNTIAAGRTAPDKLTRRRTVQRALDRVADQGITASQDNKGRRMSLPAHVEQVIADAAHHAGVSGFLSRLVGRGDDLVIVTRSPHPCPVCEPWEEKVLSISGRSRRRPSLATARDEGLFHPRCRHTIFHWERGFEWPPNSIERQPGSYEAEQRQRTIERTIRKYKRRKAAAVDDVARMAAGRKVRQWEAELRRHLAAEGLRRSRQRERTDFGHSRPLTHALGA